MRYSKLMIPTTKEIPAEAEIPSHQLMIRAGYFRKVASGTYTYLPLGLRCLQKIENIIRTEMNNSDAQEILMPVLQPIDLWQKTGRDEAYGETLSKHIDRHGRTNVLAPTAEEVVTHLVAGEIKSYKQLPVNFYQINTKFRDEFRPRFGALRSREFIMKDAYSFDADLAGLDKSYEIMREAYIRIFERCGLDFVVVDAASGEIGGSGSQEFMVRCSAGEDTILSSDKQNYAANVEKCGIGTREHSLSGQPTGELTKVHTPAMKSIEDVGKFMKVKPVNLLKTLVFQAENDWVVAVVRGDHELNEVKLKALAGPKITMEIDEDAAEKAGFAIGFVGPHVIASCDNIRLFIDADAAAEQFWAAGANEIDHHVKHFNWQRDVLDALGENWQEKVVIGDLRNAQAGDLSPLNDGGVLGETKGIEVGHIFKLGDKYSKSLGAKYLDENGQENACVMGCYGIGINRILASAVESSYDENGCVLPISIAPFEIEIVQLNNDNENVTKAATELYNQLKDAGYEVLFDDRDLRPGVKFKDADLIGIPLRIVIGQRGLDQGKIEIKRRTDNQPILVDVEQVLPETQKIISQMYQDLTPSQEK